MWDKDKIKTIIPHREPFLFIDEVSEIDEGKRIVAKKYIDPNESFFKGHFPGNPVMPGVLIIEAMAQAALLFYYTVKPEIVKNASDYYLAKVNSEFLSPVYPGDTLTKEAREERIVDTVAIIKTTAMVGDRLIAEATGIFAIKQKGKQEAENQAK